MKIFSVAAVLTGIVLLSLGFRRKKAQPASAVPADSDRRYAIDDLMNDLD